MRCSTVKAGKFFFFMHHRVSHHLLVHLLANFSPHTQKTALLAHTAADVGNVTHHTELFEYFLMNVGRFVYNNTYSRSRTVKSFCPHGVSSRGFCSRKKKTSFESCCVVVKPYAWTLLQNIWMLHKPYNWYRRPQFLTKPHFGINEASFSRARS
jgi:hypothetical protein